MDAARQLLSDTSVNITTDGRPYLGAAVGSQAYVADYISSKVSSWANQLEVLASFAVTLYTTAGCICCLFPWSH